MLSPGMVDALTPIARWDVVPYQRITQGEVLNIGVVAFSKAEIDRVNFSISGQGYSGAASQSSYTMTFNNQTKVYEYWIPLSANDFTSNGIFTISANVYGKDGGMRSLETLPMIVNATGTFPAPKAWVGNSGSNTTGQVGNRAAPFASLGGAVNAIQGINGGSSDGATVYLFEGNYSLGSGVTSTTNEWLTLTRDEAARKDYTRITNAGTAVRTSYMRFKGITIQSSGSLVYLTTRPATIWVDDCVIQGSGRYVTNSNPVKRDGNDETEYPSYFTDTEIYDVDYGMHRGILARNVTIKRTGNDPFVNVICIINAVVEDVDPGSTYWHADGYQSWGPGPRNRIIYGYYGTDLHAQGLFMRQTVGNPGINNAFVNMFIEMRPPGRPGYEGGPLALVSGNMTGAWDHLLIWNCSFLGGEFQFYDEPSGVGVPLSFNNTSFIGNIWYSFIDFEGTIGTDPTYAQSNNSGNNEFLNNHFIYSYIDNTEGPNGAQNASVFSFSPDSVIVSTQSSGEPDLDLSTGSLGIPLSNSILVDRINNKLIHTDALGRLRDNNPDIGALEFGAQEPPDSNDQMENTSNLYHLRIEN